MSKHTIKGFIVYEVWAGEVEGKYRFQEYRPLTNSKDCKQIPVCGHTLSFEVPAGFDPRPDLIEKLKAEKEKVRADSAARITELDAQIGKLLAIENTVSA